jgi:DNA gyrase subunit A
MAIKEKVSDLQDELENRFLTYALSTIVSRSLPDVRDGLKPIHRRILYAMDQMGVSSAAKYVKSAKIIGEVLGKYHPHGDASTYESMVRMAQDFSMRYPLVDGKGNFGSVDGDSPAAYRYTEGKLTPITAHLLADLKKETVDFRPNYDNTLKEPVVLPSGIPNLLVNGASGIAVGMACSFPSHNLREVIRALIDLIENPKPTVAGMLKHIKGPDFPTGGTLQTGKADLRKAYETGSGAVRVRGTWQLEKLPRGRQQIIITSIPYGVNKARMIEKIAEIIIGKKLPPLTDVRDESDEAVRVVLEIKTGTDPEKVMSYLVKHTDFESPFAINFTCLKPNGEPDRLSLLDIGRYFLDFRKEVVTRRLNHELLLLKRRLHLLAGFALIFKDLDRALRLIRSSKSRREAHEKLKTAFKLDDEQTAAILEIPLYRLVSMEIDKILAEKREKTAEKNRIEAILKSDRKIWKEVRGELEQIDKQYGDKRKTAVKGGVELAEFNAEDFIEHEEVHLVLSQNGWLRKLKSLSGDAAALKFKENDAFLAALHLSTRDRVALVTSFGMLYVQKVFNLPYTRAGFGEPVQHLFKFKDGERVVQMFALPGEGAEAHGGGKQQLNLAFAAPGEAGMECMVATEGGYGFRFLLDNFDETTRSGRKIMSLAEGDRLIKFSPVTGSQVFLASTLGKGLRLEVDQITLLSGRGRGVRLMKLGDGKLAGFSFVTEKDKVTLVLEDGSQRPVRMADVPVYKRGSQGVKISVRKKITSLL